MFLSDEELRDVQVTQYCQDSEIQEARNGRDKKYIQKFGGQTSCKTTIYKTEEETEGQTQQSIMMDLRERGCEAERWIELAQLLSSGGFGISGVQP